MTSRNKKNQNSFEGKNGSVSMLSLPQIKEVQDQEDIVLPSDIYNKPTLKNNARSLMRM